VDSGVLFKGSVTYPDDTTFGVFLERFLNTVFGKAKKYAERSIICSFIHLGYKIHHENEKEKHHLIQD
jgi:hypothetical protein